MWHPGKPAGWQSGGSVCYIWKQVRQLHQIHGVQRLRFSQLQAAKARGVGSTWWPHRPLPASPWSVMMSTKLIFSSLHYETDYVTKRCSFSGVSNEARFVFTMQSIVMPQKLKGTLTFIVKVSKEIHMQSTRWRYLEIESWQLDLFRVRSKCFTTQSSSFCSVKKLGRRPEMYPWVWFHFTPGLTGLFRQLCGVGIWTALRWGGKLSLGFILVTDPSSRCHTVTYFLSVAMVLQNEDSSTHEKLDFKLHFTCTSYLITTPCYRLVI